MKDKNGLEHGVTRLRHIITKKEGTYCFFRSGKGHFMECAPHTVYVRIKAPSGKSRGRFWLLENVEKIV